MNGGKDACKTVHPHQPTGPGLGDAPRARAPLPLGIRRAVSLFPPGEGNRRVLLLSPRWYVFVQWRLALDWPVQARRFPSLGYDLLMMHVLGAELVVCRAHEPS